MKKRVCLSVVLISTCGVLFACAKGEALEEPQQELDVFGRKSITTGVGDGSDYQILSFDIDEIDEKYDMMYFEKYKIIDQDEFDEIIE